MASLNVAEWSPGQVEEWLSGLGPTVARYAPGLRKRGLDGNKLLMLRCDDLEYLGMHIIGHQELLLEAVEHLRNFQYEARRECVQQLAARVSAAATGLARALQPTDTRLHTQTLADVAATVRAVKPLVCWLDRWPVVASRGARALSERKAQLLQLSLEAATCAQRDRFAHQPARAVAAAAAAVAAAADYIVQEVVDPQILVPASLDAVTLKQGGKPLGFDVVPSFCGHHQLADIRFGSPAHASGQVHEGDEIVQVGDRCVIGWSGASVMALLERGISGELPLRLRRRAARPPPAAHPLRLRTRHRPPPPMLSYEYSIISSVRAGTIHPAAKTLDPEPVGGGGRSDSDSDALSPPASPHLPPNEPASRLFALAPAQALTRRHTVAGDSPAAKPTHHAIHQFWRQLREHRWERGDDDALYRRDKAVSCSTGLELSPRPRTCTGVPHSSPLSPALPHDSPGLPQASPAPHVRGKLDKSHSTPAYDCSADNTEALQTQVIPESPTLTPADSPTILVHSAEKADQILEFKKSSSQIGEAIEQRRRADDDRGKVLEALNIAALQHRRRSILENERNKFFANDVVNIDDAVTSPTRLGSKEPPVEATAPWAVAAQGGPVGQIGGGAGRGTLPVLRYVPRPPSPPAPRPNRHLDGSQISLPLRHITKHDIKVLSDRREMPPINLESDQPPPPEPRPRKDPAPPAEPRPRRDPALEESKPVMLSPTAGVVKSIFPTSKSKSLKKKNSILAKRRCIAMRTLLASGDAATAGSTRCGVAWQRVRARHAQQPRWARRHLLLAHRALYAYRDTECSKADCMINLEGFTASAASEVKSRAHAWKVYHTGTAFYFAARSHADMLAWIHCVAAATLHHTDRTSVDISQQFSETDYSDTESDSESSERRERERREEREKEKDKSKFGSLKKLTGRMQRSESSENVGHSTSLDRKYLRFFSRNKSKDDSKLAKVTVPGVTVPGPGPVRRAAHGSQPELAPRLPTHPAPSLPAHPAHPAPRTLEQFMLAEQANTRQQMYTDRVVQGIAADPPRRETHNVPSPLPQNRNMTTGDRRLRTSPGNNGSDKRGGTEEPASDSPHERWRDSLRRNHKVHSAQSRPQPATPAGASWAGGVSRLRLVFGAAPQYPHLQCPPTFQPESYSLAQPAPAPLTPAPLTPAPLSPTPATAPRVAPRLATTPARPVCYSDYPQNR